MIEMGDAIEFDAVVIGAGVIGLAIANEICDVFDNVIVIEKESDFGQHVSSRHSGVVHSGIYYKPGSLKANLCVEGNRLLYDFAEKNNINYLNCGKLVVGHDDNDLKKLEALLENGTINGVEGLSLLSYQEAIKIQPKIKCQNALWVPSTGIIDSHLLMAQFEKEVTSKDGLIYYNSEIVSIAKIDSNYILSLREQDDKISTPIVINCAGLWCDAVAGMLGIDKYKIHYCKGDYYQSNKYKDLKCLIYPLPDKIGLGIHTVLQLDGSVSFGPNAYYVDEIDYSIDDRHLDSFHSSINEYLDLDKEELKIDYSGIRPKPFAVDEAPKDFVIKNEIDLGFPNLINLIGIESPGLTCSLAIGRYVKGIVKY
jgi:L-2-hydroxyglutarate oxidase LhgO